MKYIRYIVLMLALSLAMPMWGQVDKKDVRRGNKDFRKGEYEMAFQDYLRAFEKDTTSVAANYNMAGALYRMEQYDQAQQALDRIKETAPATASAAAAAASAAASSSISSSSDSSCGIISGSNSISGI